MEENKNDLQLKELTNLVDPGNEQHINPDHSGHDHGTVNIQKKEILAHWDLQLRLRRCIA